MVPVAPKKDYTGVTVAFFLKLKKKIPFYSLGGSFKHRVFAARVTSADFSASVFALAVVALAVLAVDAAVPRRVTGTLATQALT